MGRKRKHLWFLWAAALVAAFGLFSYAFRGVLFSRPVPSPISAPVLFRHPFSGRPLSEEMELPRVYGVMIENMIDARPQMGLDKASLVIEAPVEAAIPRLLVFFTEDQEVGKIGPVRSARPYFIDWNAMFRGVYAHVGGSPDALQRLRDDDTVDLDEVSHEWFYWRDQMREAPHNVYTSTELLKKGYERFARSFKEVAISYERALYKNDTPSADPTGTFVRVRFQPDEEEVVNPYAIEWKYDAAQNAYRRFQGGGVHKMEDGAEIVAKNVAVMETDVEILDAVGRRRVRTVGKGNAVLFQDGNRVEATWKKTSRTSRLRFFDEGTSEELFLNAGATWIEVVPSLDEDVEM